jgi:hypothetical protein
MYQEHDMDMALTEYMDKIQASYNKYQGMTDQWLNSVNPYLETETKQLNITFVRGSKFFKCVVNGSAHSFICRKAHDKWRVGDVLKAASWAAPAKNFVRGNVLTQDYDTLHWTGV